MQVFIAALLLVTSFLTACSGQRPLKVSRIDLKERDDVRLQFIHADALALEGETRRSTAELAKLIERFPENAYLHYLFAMNLAQERRYDDAAESIHRVLELQPAFVDARVFLGKLKGAQGRHADAAREFASALRTDPKQEDIYALLANEHLVLREPARALEVLRRLLGVNPDSVIAYFLMGTIYDQHLRQPARALGMYQEALSIDPANSNVHNAIAELYLHRRQPRKALAKYEEIAHLEPDNVAVQLRIALIHYELKEYESAIAVFEAILAKHPDADKVRFYLGVLYEGTQNLERAALELLRVPPNSSYFKDARLHVASIFRQEKKDREAVAVLEEAIKQKGQIPEFYEYLAALHEEREQYPEAIEILVEGRRALPDDEKIAFLLGILYEKALERESAIAAMREVLRINPQNASALNYIGYTLAERGERLEEALEMVERALVLRPGDGYITDSLGWVYYRLGDHERALLHLQRANRLVPREPTVLEHLAEVTLSRGDRKGARRFLEQALEALQGRPQRDEQEIQRVRERLESF